MLKALKAQLNEVTEVRVSRGDGSKTTLKKQPSGWIVAERDYAADSGKVRKLLIDLSSLETVEIKTSDPAKYSQLGVEDANDADGGRHADRSRDARESARDHHRQDVGDEVGRTCARPTASRACSRLRT